MRKTLLLILLLLVVTGCTAIRGTKLPENFAEQLPSSYKIKDFPHIRQYDGYSCATTSLAMVMSYYDQKTYGKSKVWDASGSSITQVKKVCGNDMNGLKVAAKKYGFTEYEFVRGLSLNELKYMISQDIPVIVNIRNFWQESYHAVVVIGYDEEDFIFADPASPSESYHENYDNFNKHWYASLCSPRGKKQRHTAFILYPKQ